MNRIVLFLVVLSHVLFSQNITNTLGTTGLFSIKDGSTVYLSLSQSSGYLSLNRSLNLSYTTSSTTGVIYKGSERFIHDYLSPGTQGANTFVGLNSGNFSMSGIGAQSSYNTALGKNTLSSLTSGSENTAVGSNALYFNTTGVLNTSAGSFSLYFNTGGISNTSVGYSSLYSNTIGNQNSAFGVNSLRSNTTGYSNTAMGNNSLYNNTFGYENTGLGIYSLYSNTSGFYNTALGRNSLYSNTTGNSNTGLGSNSLYSNTNGFRNTALGYESLFSNTTGVNNTAVGYRAGNLITTGINNIAIGNDAQVPSGTSSNQVRIGNTSVSYAGVQVAWTITSDRRLKQDILSSNLGLGFISKLKPVSYTRINDESQKTEYGFIAQDVDAVLKEFYIEKTGMISIDEKGRYELRYNDLLAPMVKAIQELKEENNVLKKEVESLKKTEKRLAELERIILELNLSKKVKLTDK